MSQFNFDLLRLDATPATGDALNGPFDPVQNLQHVAEGLSLLISQYVGRPRLEGWLESYLEQVQDVEDALFSIVALSLATAQERQLEDVYGPLLDERREGLGVEVFRNLLQAKALAIRSNATPETVISIAQKLLSGLSYAEGNMGISIFGVLLDGLPIERVIKILRFAKGHGVVLTLSYIEFGEDPDDYFSFADADVTQPDQDNGFAFDGPPVVGGIFSLGV